MIKPEIISLLRATVSSLSEKYGVNGRLSVEQFVEDLCVIRVDKKTANSEREKVTAVASELLCVKGVKDVTDLYADDVLRGAETRDIYIGVRKGLWSYTDADRKFWKDYDDPNVQRKLEQEKRVERKKHYKDYLLPIPPPSRSRPTELYLTMSYKPYDQIAAGEKRTEFRAYTPSWVRRILSNAGTLKTIKFQRGYGGRGRPKPEQMIWTIRKIDLYDIETRESSDPINVKVGFIPTHIAIDIGRRVDEANKATQKDGRMI